MRCCRTKPTSLGRLIAECRLSLDDFEPVTTIGSGTFGRVLLIRSLEDHRFYALKKLSKWMITKLKQVCIVFTAVDGCDESAPKTSQVDHLNAERAILEEVEHPMVVKM